MNAPQGYTEKFLPTLTGPVMFWRCGDCGGLIAPEHEDAATHDRWHDRLVTVGRR